MAPTNGAKAGVAAKQPAEKPATKPAFVAPPPALAASQPTPVRRVSVPCLPHGIEDVARRKAALSARQAALCTGEDGLLYFAGDAAGALVLPAETAGNFLDTGLAAKATSEGAINCVSGCDSYVVVRTTPDGNCLSHACSLGVWGVHDADAELRRAISSTMASAGAGGATRRRFEAALARSGIPPSDWDCEWSKEVAVFNGSLRGGRGGALVSRGFLSDVHCFVLANVLRRPLVIYGSALALSAGLAGVYLPLLWAGQPGAPCSRVPTSLLYHNSHFSVLATLGDARRLPLAVALDGVPHPLPLRFLLREEEGRSGDLLRTWLDLAARPRGLPPGVAAFELPRCGEPGSPLLG